MKFSEKWLREWVNPDITTETLCEQLTMAGLEVDGVEAACEKFSGVIVAEVLTVEAHPDADKLKICQVYNGKEKLTIVCGASNVKANMKVALATVGGSIPVLPSVKVVRLKGVESFGMLCSAKELGLGDEHDGIMELPASLETGKDLNKIFETDDNVIEISPTPNRGDCLSIQGVAREVAVLNQIQRQKISLKRIKPTIDSTRDVSLEAKNACARYCGRIIKSVDASVKTPIWMVERLRRSDVRSISIIVDISNYVMLELGQPMHAFDNDKLQGTISVRYSTTGETLRLLDENEYEIQPETLLIADESGPLAMAGIMGGYDSAVSEDSTCIFLESAFFLSEVIIGKARQYGLHTDSSHRFERGVDPELQMRAIERATELILKYCGGEPGPVVEVEHKASIPVNPEVILRKSQISRILGIELDNVFVEAVLNKLDIQYRYEKNQWFTKAPSHRFDINIEVDLIEELVRIHGYHEVKAAVPISRMSLKSADKNQRARELARSILINRDYQEIISYSFVDPELNKLLKINDKTMLLTNPISPELAEMRVSLWPGLIKTMQYNIKRQQDRVRLFETGLIFQGNDNLQQKLMLSGCLYGNKNKKQWGIDNSLCDFYDLKQDVMSLICQFVDDSAVEYIAAEHAMLHPGQCLEIKLNGEKIGVFGQLHPQISKSLKLPEKVYLFEISIEKLGVGKHIQYQAISKFPAISRDIAIVIDDDIVLKDVLEEIKKSATNLLTNLELFDVYHGEGIENGKKSLAMGLTFHATSSTLKDEEIEVIMDSILAGLNNKFGATLRE